MMDDPNEYSKHRMIQINDTMMFMPLVVFKMDWSRPQEDTLMDIGCGNGNSILNLVSSFPKMKKVEAIDVSSKMIEYAKKNNSHESIEYHVADIGKRDSIQKWEGTISKVISIHCLHWLKDIKNAFKNIYYLLTPGGQASIMFPLTATYWDSFGDLINDPKWNKYLANAEYLAPESHYQKWRASDFRTMLEDLNFKVIICEEDEKNQVFLNDEILEDEIFPIYGLKHNIPAELIKEFKKDVAKTVIKYDGRTPEGNPRLQYTVIHLLIQKPNDATCSN